MIHAESELRSSIAAIAAGLPMLPSTIRYYDDFTDEYRSIRNPRSLSKWDIRFDGRKVTLNFSELTDDLSLIFKHIAADILHRLDPSAAANICAGLLGKAVGTGHLIGALTLSPEDFRNVWNLEIQSSESWGYSRDIRTLLHSLCNLSIGFWNFEMRPFVSLLKSPPQDPYSVVRTGECFLPLDHQSLLIDYLDELSEAVKVTAKSQSTTELRNACILVISHQYGCRPGQIARLKIADVRSYESGAVHLSIPLLKQRGNEVLRRVTRRVKQEWGPIFVEYSARRLCTTVTNGIPADNYFAIPPGQLSAALSGLIEKITGTRWTPTDLRHTAAQRLADAGTSHLSLSEFMGHATTLTANVYFEASPTQAQRINQALALSPIYSNVAEVARTRTIDKATLLHLPADQQIGGVPHGIPIAGIGGCSGGQSLCSKNPILSCYTCRKFLPLSDAAIHESVVESLRPVVNEFASASRFNEESPAYTQLRRMFEAALEVARDIRLKQVEGGS